MTTPFLVDGTPLGPIGLDTHGLAPEGNIHWNNLGVDLIERAVKREEGVLSTHGVLMTNLSFVRN